MQNDVDSAAEYRKRAGELREIASRTHDDAMRQSLLKLAGDYDQLALTRELIDQIDRERKHH